MLKSVNPKLPMRNKAITKNYYINQLGFTDIGSQDYEDYLLLKKDEIEIHFFKFPDLVIEENYGQVYIRVSHIEDFYQSLIDYQVEIHPHGKLQAKPWGQKEFSLLDPNYNLLTFGEAI